MIFPRNPQDNSLDWVAFEQLNEEEQDAALLDLEDNGTEEEQKQIEEYFAAQLLKTQQQRDALQIQSDFFRHEFSVLQAEMEALSLGSSELNIELEAALKCIETKGQQPIIYSHILSPVDNQDLTMNTVDSSTSASFNKCNGC